MTAVAHSTAPALTVKVYKNGNPNFRGKNFVINRRHIRTMGALYDEITAHIGPSNAVRNIYTPQRGSKVQSLENLTNRSDYVAAGREGFKKLNYADLGVIKPRPPRKANNSPRKGGVYAAEGRHKMDYEWGKRDLKIIHVFCNGDVFRPSVKIVLQKRLQQSMDQILNIVQDHVVMAAAIGVLYTIDGKPIFEPSKLTTGGMYVAVERGRFFKRANYGGAASPLTKSPRGAFLPPISNSQMTNQEGRQPRNRIARKKLRAAKSNSDGNKSVEQSRDQSRFTTTSVVSPRDLTSNLSIEAAATNALLRVSEDLDNANSFTISASPPARIDDETPVPERGLPKTWSEDADDLTALDVFKASGLQSVKAAEIRDTRQTTVEKPIDLLPAEEVLEEELEEAGNEKETTDNNRSDNFQLKQFVSELVDEIVEDDVESIEDDSAPKQVEDKDDLKETQQQAWQNDGREEETKSSAEKEQETASSRQNKERARSSSTGENEEDSAPSPNQEDTTADETEASGTEGKDEESERRPSSQEKLARSEADAATTTESQPKNDSEETKNEGDLNSSMDDSPAKDASENEATGKETLAESKPSAEESAPDNSANSNNTYFS